MTNARKLPNKWTREKLASLKVADRHTIWKRARTMATPEAIALAEEIEDLGLPYFDPKALTNDDPVTIQMYQIINSPDGKAACLAANDAGLPAIAGVDGMLNEALGIEYQGANLATATAGALVGELMRSLGYEKAGQRQMPEGSIAKTGAYWIPRAKPAGRK
jgi:hypothetical protein